MAKKKSKGTAFAAVFMALAIAGSIPLGVNRSLSRLRETASQSYYYDQAGYAIYDGIEKRRAAASDLVTLANRYKDQEPKLESLIDSLEYRIKSSENAWSDDDTFAPEAQANAGLDEPAQALATALEGMDLSEKDRKYPQQIMDQMKSEQDKIQRSSYNDDAKEFNEKLQKLRPIAMLEPMATFDSYPPDSMELAPEAVEGTGIPSPPEAPEAPDAPELDRISEQARVFAGNMADRAGTYADDVTSSVEDFVDNVLNGILG